MVLAAKNVAKLIALQFTTALVMWGVLEALTERGGTRGWVSATAAMIGAMAFAMMAEEKEAGALTTAVRSRLALWSTAVQAGLGACLLPTYPGLGELPLVWLAVILVVAALATYGMTRVGLNMGVKNVKRARDAKRAPSAAASSND